MKIGIVGQGFVGTAVNEGMKNYFTIETFDKYKESTCNSLEELVEKTKYIFICLPTPSNGNGSANIDLVEETVLMIDKLSRKGTIAIIKSTVPPKTTEILNSKCKKIQAVFNPEFLTEANFLDDFKNQNRIIIGGPRPASTKVKNIFSKVFPTISIIKTSSTIAEMIKYVTNTFLSTKVSFANEMKMICDTVNIDYDKVIEYVKYDDRLGESHWNVPGPDGHYGFGGSCFPKDIQALISFAQQAGINPRVLNAVWNTNLKVRPEKDWEKLVGRSVVGDKEQ